jgi:hypothetical protein
MYPDLTLGVLSIVQTAAASLLATSEPAFLDIARRTLTATTVGMLTMQGLKWMYMPGASESNAYEFARLVLRIATGLTMLVFYVQPIPGMGISASHIVLDSTAYLASLLDARSTELAFSAIDDLWSRAVYPSVTDIGAMGMWLILYAVVLAAKAATIAVIAFSFIASATLALVGPLFVACYPVPALSHWFQGWLRAFVSYSFLRVVTLAYLSIGQKLITTFVAQLPPTISPDLYALYLVQVVAVLVTFVTGIVALPLVNSSIFSGGSSTGGVGTGVLTMIARRGH